MHRNGGDAGGSVGLFAERVMSVRARFHPNRCRTRHRSRHRRRRRRRVQYTLADDASSMCMRMPARCNSKQTWVGIHPMYVNIILMLSTHTRACAPPLSQSNRVSTTDTTTTPPHVPGTQNKRNSHMHTDIVLHLSGVVRFVCRVNHCEFIAARLPVRIS